MANSQMIHNSIITHEGTKRNEYESRKGKSTLQRLHLSKQPARNFRALRLHRLCRALKRVPGRRMHEEGRKEKTKEINPGELPVLRRMRNPVQGNRITNEVLPGMQRQILGV